MQLSDLNRRADGVVVMLGGPVEDFQSAILSKNAEHSAIVSNVDILRSSLLHANDVCREIQRHIDAAVLDRNRVIDEIKILNEKMPYVGMSDDALMRKIALNESTISSCNRADDNDPYGNAGQNAGAARSALREQCIKENNICKSILAERQGGAMAPGRVVNSPSRYMVPAPARDSPEVTKLKESITSFQKLIANIPVEARTGRGVEIQRYEACIAAKQQEIQALQSGNR